MLICKSYQANEAGEASLRHLRADDLFFLLKGASGQESPAPKRPVEG